MFDKWRRIAFVSCMHVGSKVGLWPISYTYEDETETEHTIHAKEVQTLLLQYWRDFWDSEAKTADTIVLLGDLIQGNNRKETAMGTMTANLNVQRDVAVHMLKPHIKGRTVIGVSGSKYHDSIDTSLDKSIVTDKDIGGDFVGMVRNLKISDGPIINIAHGSSNPLVYKSTHDDREMWFMAANSMTRDIDFVVRGHWHYFSYIRNSRRAVLRVPGWQCWYPASFMVDGLGKKNNKLGAVVVDFGPDKRHMIWDRLYEPPVTWSEPRDI